MKVGQFTFRATSKRYIDVGTPLPAPKADVTICTSNLGAPGELHFL
jgi:hypothetical protein